MAEYIDRDAAIRAVRHAWAKGLEPTQYIEEIPAANVVPTPRWINVAQKRPELPALVYLSNGEIRSERNSVFLVHFFTGETFYFDAQNYKVSEERWYLNTRASDATRNLAFTRKLPHITHWMPLDCLPDPSYYKSTKAE